MSSHENSYFDGCIFPLDELSHSSHSATRCSGCSYYCTLCESDLWDLKATDHHIQTYEHSLYLKRRDDRQSLKEMFMRQTPGHAEGLRDFYTRLMSTQRFDYSETVEFIVAAIQRALGRNFGNDAHLSKTGSMLTNLHCTKRPHCAELNLFLEMSGQYSQNELGSIYDMVYTILNKDPILANELKSPEGTGHISAQRVYGWYCPALTTFVEVKHTVYRVSLAFGPIAKRAHLSSKLVLAYCCIWPPLRLLSAFVRIWAERLQLVRASVPVGGLLTNYALDLMVIYYLQRTRYLPVLNELLATSEFCAHFQGISVEQLCLMNDADMRAVCYSIARLYYGERPPTLSVGELVYGFFKFYAINFGPREVVQITQGELIDKQPVVMKMFVVKDPFLSTNLTYFRPEFAAYFSKSILLSAYYFCIPRTPDGPIWEVKFVLKDLYYKNASLGYAYIDSYDFNGNPENVPELLLEKLDRFAIDYNFDWILEQLGGPPPVVCKFCSKSHDEMECELIRLHTSISPPRLSAHFQPIINRTIQQFYESTKLTDARHKKIEKFISEMQQLFMAKLPHKYGGAVDDIRLVKFGSLINGFGKFNCDLDLCLQSEKLDLHNNNKDGVNFLIQCVARLMREQGYLVETVLHAKVPIVKFHHQGSGFEGDISVYNTLAIQNSDLLRVYAEFDRRVAPLGFAIKFWAKMFDLNDASTGSISSYAYIIMLIHYLQNCEPPVLPILQEVLVDADGRSVEEEYVERWRVAFPRKVNHLKSNFNNGQGLGELFVGFFAYYTGKFDLNFDVVQVRRSAPIKKMDKEDGRWNVYTMCVEDPFDHAHNLTGGIKPQGFIYLLRCMFATQFVIQKRDFQLQHNLSMGFVGENDRDQEFQLQRLAEWVTSNEYFVNGDAPRRVPPNRWPLQQQFKVFTTKKRPRNGQRPTVAQQMAAAKN